MTPWVQLKKQKQKTTYLLLENYKVSKKSRIWSQALWHIPVIPIHRREEAWEFKARLNYMISSSKEKKCKISYYLTGYGYNFLEEQSLVWTSLNPFFNLIPFK